MKITKTDSPYPSKWDYEISEAEKQWVQKALAKAQKQFPDIDEYGLESIGQSSPFDLDHPWTVAQILFCKEFIELCGIIKTPSIGSYTLKHECENWAKFDIPNGAFCVAAIGLNVPLKPYRMSINARLGISKAGVKKMQGTKRENS